ncbi:DUF1688 domain-containing protein [Caulobacter sp. CCUG 60055]|nr:DUF1688 family protein [Caulobacteraceae bacterium]MCI3180329.1 DUF1688 domain-containing protein [Caulobacter sp. CCUG 60055]
MTSKSSEAAAARSLLSAAAVRERAHELFAIALDGRLPDWTIAMERLPAAADFVASTVRDRYPDLAVPFHARWRHFVLAGRDLWAEASTGLTDPAGRARAAFDLAITSVLLDAGAGAGWRFVDPASGVVAARSEGLGVASLRLFESGALSDRPGEPLRADAGRLSRLEVETLAEGFQVSEANPLVGLEGRAALLRRLGETVAARPDLFAIADAPRPGGLFDVMAASAEGGRLPAAVILEVLLEALGPIWAGRLSLGGVPLGDCWRHPALRRDDATDGLVPLHKLSQWLAYSLIEPLQAAGVAVTGIDGLTGLAEYRNGGLFVDLGVLVPRDPAAPIRRRPVDDTLVVGWRALTVALLDEIAPLTRQRLGVGEADFPLARVLEGGTWAAGRAAARQRREDGSPPVAVDSDGTVF